MKQQIIKSFEVWKNVWALSERETVPKVVSQGTVSRLALSALLSMCGLLIACTESNDSVSSSDSTEELLSGIEIDETDTSVKDQNPATQDQDPAMPINGGVLLIEVDECGIADPAVDVGSSSASRVFNLIRETHAGLTRIVEGHDIRAEAELAQSFSVRENGTLYEFTMRKDLKFSDGSPLTAADVKWSWERALRKSTGNSRANDVLGNIVGAEDVVLHDSQDLVGVEVVDETHLRVQLQVPRPEFPILIADPVAYVLKRDNVDEWGEAWVNDTTHPGQITHVTGIIPNTLPIGAGPFKIAEYAHPETTRNAFAGEARCVLERNEYYWGRTSYIDAIVAIVRQDLLWNYEATFERQKELLGSGEIDITMIRPSDIDNKPDSIKHIRGNLPPTVEFLTFNPSQSPLDDVHLRRALAKVIDVDAAIRYINDAPNQNRLVPQSIYIHDSDVSTLDLDISSAKNELDVHLQSSDNEASNINITLYSISPPEIAFSGIYSSAIFDVWQDTLGIYIDKRQLDFESSTQFAEIQITDVDFTLHYPSPHGVLLEFLNAMGDNNTAPEIVEIREQLSTAASTLDDVERIRRYEDIERRILDDALVIPVVVLEPHIDLLTQPWVNGLSLTQYPGSLFHNVWLSEDAPDRAAQ